MTHHPTDQSDIERVREATDLVRLIGEHVTLQSRGREFRGLCPFHDDHRPSMDVVTHKGPAFYYCQSCGATGDCFTFVKEYHKMDFAEALRYLADRAGVELRPRSRRSGAEGGDAPSRSSILGALAFAQDFFRRTLDDPALGRDARATIDRRGIGAEMVERFGIGAAPAGFDGLHRELASRARGIEVGLAAGLLRQREGRDGCYDVFRNRLIFPIGDQAGRTIAFGGRIIDPDDQPKYLNSPESPVFRKSQTLYGLHLARRAIIDSGRALVTEGYTDVVACHQAGIANVVGTLGTALTREHAAILGRICDTVVLIFDGDEAGRRAADRGVEVFFAAPVDVKICVLPDGLDPDDLIRHDDGPERFRAAVEESIDALEYKLRRFEDDLRAAGGLSARQKRMEAFLAELSDLGFGALQGVRKRLVVTRVADLLGMPVNDVEGALPRHRPAARAPAGAATDDAAPLPRPDQAPVDLLGSEERPVSRRRRIAEGEVIGLLLFGADDRAEFEALGLHADEFAHPLTRRIAEAMLPHLTRGRPAAMADILGRLSDEQVRATAARLFDEQRRRFGDREGAARAAVAAAVATLRACVDEERFQEQTKGFRSGGAAIVAVAVEDPAIESVVAEIKKRGEHGFLPGAISHGVRS